MSQKRLTEIQEKFSKQEELNKLLEAKIVKSEEALENQRLSSESAKRQMEAFKAESELVSARFLAEKENMEKYHQVLIEKKLSEKEAESRDKIEKVEEIARFVCIYECFISYNVYIIIKNQSH